MKEYIEAIVIVAGVLSLIGIGAVSIPLLKAVLCAAATIAAFALLVEIVARLLRAKRTPTII